MTDPRAPLTARVRSLRRLTLLLPTGPECVEVAAGQEYAESRRLARERGCAVEVAWLGPLGWVTWLTVGGIPT